MTTPTADEIARVVLDQARHLERLQAINDRMRGQLDEVRALHVPDVHNPGLVAVLWCAKCDEPYPCETARAAAPGRVVVEEGDL